MKIQCDIESGGYGLLVKLPVAIPGFKNYKKTGLRPQADMMVYKNKNNDCGQVSVDFMIAMVIFVLTIAFTFRILTGMFVPFISNTDDLQATADRISVQLVEDSCGLVSDGATPNMLLVEGNGSMSKLNNSMNSGEYEKIKEEMGLVHVIGPGNWSNDVNISLTYFNNTLYPDNSAPLLQGGPEVLDYSIIAHTKRIVTINRNATSLGETLILSVKVW